MKVGFIGLGTMGAPMAKRLALSGFELRLYDIDPTAASNFLDFRNCIVTDSPEHAAEGVDCLVTMLPESQHVHDAVLGSKGAINALRDGSMIVEMTTGSVDALHKLASKLATRNIRIVDAPVARSPKEAELGDLLVLAGGSEEDLSRVRPMLEALGKEIVHAGPLGSGLLLKLINNYMSMVGMAMTAEVLNFATTAGLDRNLVVRTLQKTPAGQGQINTNFPKKVLAGNLDPDFPMRMGLKDINLGLELAQKVGVPTPLGSAAQQIFALSLPWGRANQDCTAMLHLFHDLSGAQAS